ncbi:hypothetical protein CLPU_22c00060 [Gottschalkia purinilytica]|uniref:Uncharacterized protein n=1 Tax=Gottschalkia purinilytica TaxID=1503 RepID=A0A0L0W6K1_GOTPU|nr:hypothetical protein [Gottschalkia purinilytica]KNF07154.1 hypothetical protein CLPU_22c00060 [Gottschalkia purinilytica]
MTDKKDTERKQTSHEEKLSEREWKELMGVYRNTYKKVRGAFRQR